MNGSELIDSVLLALPSRSYATYRQCSPSASANRTTGPAKGPGKRAATHILRVRPLPGVCFPCRGRRLYALLFHGLRFALGWASLHLSGGAAALLHPFGVTCFAPTGWKGCSTGGAMPPIAGLELAHRAFIVRSVPFAGEDRSRNCSCGS